MRAGILVCYVFMVKWNSYLVLILSLAFAGLSLAQEAYDDEAFEESAEVKLQRQDAEFFEATKDMGERGFSRSVQEIKRLAVAGHARSQHMLGMFFRYGTGVRKNAKRSVQWLKLAADQQYPAAMLAYAEAALSGEGMRVDETLARELLEPISAKDWNFPVPIEDFSMMRSMRSQASYLLAVLLAEGKGGKEDFGRAIELMKEASGTGALYATMYLAIEYAKGEKLERDLVEARRYFDLVELQVFDSARREIETAMMGIVDTILEKEIREEAEKMGKQLAKGLMVGQRLLAEDFLKEGSKDYDPNFAAGLLRLAAEGGDGIAQGWLGQLYRKGLGVEKDVSLAREWFEKAAENDSSVGRYNYAVLLLDAAESDDEIAKAKELLNTAADAGHFAAQLVLDGEVGLSVLSNDEDIALAREWEKRDDARALFALTRRAERGWTVELEDKPMKLFKSYLRSAKKGYQRAQYHVGMAYYEGNGPEQNSKKALEWLMPSAEQGNRFSIFRVAFMLENGNGIEVDKVRAAAYYEEAVAMGDLASANNLANLYVDGLGVGKDEARAMELYQKSAEGGDRVACYNIGRKYLSGKAVEVDVAKGTDWLAKSAESGYLKAVFELIEFYGLEKETTDVVELIYWREKAAELGDAESMKQVSIFYQKGIGLPVSKYKAMYWISTYLQSNRNFNIKVRNELIGSERLTDIQSFLPLDYEAVLIYSSLLLDDSWTGYDPETAFEIAKLFEKTKLFAGRLILAELHLKSGVSKAKPKLGVRLYQDVYYEAILEGRLAKHAVKAAYALSKEYASGVNVEKDPKQHAEWMKRAADVGLKLAQFKYAELLWVGAGCEMNKGKAKAYFIHLAKSGYAKAVLRLGEIYLEGDVADVDREQLVILLSQMAQTGNGRAKAILKGLGVDVAPAEEDGKKEEKLDDIWRPAVLG